MKIGIMGAMSEEVDMVKNEMTDQVETTIGGRTFVTGKLHGNDTTIVFSRWGKVASATTATLLIHNFNIDLVLFTGVAGAVDASLNIGDVVISNNLYQHDMDARPIFPKYHIPLTDTCVFQPGPKHLDQAEIATRNYLKNINDDIPNNILKKFSISNPKVKRGTIATGDQFIENSSAHPNMHLNKEVRADAVEMEGAAVAQVCEDFNKPYIIIRTISDKADHSATIDFQSFISEISNHYSRGIVKNFFGQLSKPELNAKPKLNEDCKFSAETEVL
mgnify:CR=1 FL=1|jgi:adenosylhomocysteine nucleosidase